MKKQIFFTFYSGKINNSIVKDFDIILSFIQLI